MKQTESVKIDKRLLEQARKVKQEQGVPVGRQFELAWEKVYGATKPLH